MQVDGMELPTWLCASASSVFMTTTHSIMAAEQQLDALFKTHFNTLSGLVHKPSLTMPPSISTLVYSSFFFFTFTAVCLVCGVLWSAYGKTLSADSAAHATALPSLNAIDAIPSANAIATQNLLMAAVQAVIENLLKDKKTGQSFCSIMVSKTFMPGHTLVNMTSSKPALTAACPVILHCVHFQFQVQFCVHAHVIAMFELLLL